MSEHDKRVADLLPPQLSIHASSAYMLCVHCSLAGTPFMSLDFTLLAVCSKGTATVMKFDLRYSG